MIDHCRYALQVGALFGTEQRRICGGAWSLAASRALCHVWFEDEHEQGARSGPCPLIPESCYRVPTQKTTATASEVFVMFCFSGMDQKWTESPA